ncbi:unnamed protein product [Effrenium voratum]|uniref:Pentatricopeptide repeat-containing protein n=1 Tax=Effrenium voratum TaxID=2562239 RepID=A0AA36J027_9DINO|nr:unnamed protein product [Effrenium voratum]
MAQVTTCRAKLRWHLNIYARTCTRHFCKVPKQHQPARAAKGDVVSCNVLMRAVEWQRAVSIFSSMEHRTLVSFNSVISTLSQSARWQEAIAFFDLIACRRLQPDVISYNSTISACTRGGRWQLSLALFHAVPSWDQVSYNAAMRACSSAIAWQDALGLFAELRSRSLGASTSSVNAAIGACGKAEEWQRALQLFWDMSAWSVEPDLISYNSTLSALKSSPAQTSQLWAHMAKQGRPDLVSFNALLASQHWVDALQTFAQLPLYRLAPDRFTISTLISRCSSSAWRTALKLLVHMDVPDLTCHNATLTALGRAARWQHSALLLFGDWSVRPDVISYNAAIDAFEKGTQWQLAMHCFSLHEKPNEISFGAGISACEKGGQWQSALALLRQMGRKQLRPGLVVYNAAISACEKLSQWQSALSLFRAIPLPDTFSFVAVISACEKATLWQSALHFLRVFRKTREEQSAAPKARGKSGAL